MSRRTERVGRLIQQTIGRLVLEKLADPRIDTAKMSVTRVEVGEDLQIAKVYVSVMGSEPEQRRALRALEHAGGYIRDLMMRQISLRQTPMLKFVLDTRFKKTLETWKVIEQAMDEIHRKEEAGGPENACGAAAADEETR